MAVAVEVDIPGGTEQQYEQVVAMAIPEGQRPDGFLVHVAGPTETGWRVFNVDIPVWRDRQRRQH